MYEPRTLSPTWESELTLLVSPRGLHTKHELGRQKDPAAVGVAVSTGYGAPPSAAVTAKHRSFLTAAICAVPFCVRYCPLRRSPRLCPSPRRTVAMAPKDIMTNSHAKSILNAMNALRKSNTLCDITLRVEGTDFPAHRIVLAACSDYFCAMFTSELSEKGKSFVDIQGLTASTMEILLDFVYTETVLVTVENVQELLPAACLLQLKGVKRACCDFLDSQLDPSNCLGIRDFAETHNCLDLMQAAELFSQKHFPEVVQHEEFMLLSQEEVEKLIKCDEIQVDSEEPVFEAVLNWVKHNRKEREPFLPDMLEFVRMPLLTPRYITDVIDTEPLIRCSLPCRDLVDEAKKFHLRPELRSEMQGPRTQARLGAKEVLLVIGGFGSQQSPIDVRGKIRPENSGMELPPRECPGARVEKDAHPSSQTSNP
ncbi:hypothetical protein AGOR_G00140370 [Albula goreensis]|uniref:BTB domain-containing protein n=1 Tax=Albula goreensis TaxID=1534307 RepID=A0A8T3DF35_9TELE|nr:hypothetical protein AGOR_G00140370 [Albula goreensis]